MTNPMNITRKDINALLFSVSGYDVEVMTNILDEDMIEHLYDLLEMHPEPGIRIDPDYTENLCILANPLDTSENVSIVIAARYTNDEDLMIISNTNQVL